MFSSSTHGRFVVCLPVDESDESVNEEVQTITYTERHPGTVETKNTRVLRELSTKTKIGYSEFTQKLRTLRKKLCVVFSLVAIFIREILRDSQPVAPLVAVQDEAGRVKTVLIDCIIVFIYLPSLIIVYRLRTHVPRMFILWESLHQ